VLEAVRAGNRRVIRVLVSNGRGDGRLNTIVAEVRSAGVPVQLEPAQLIRRLAGGQASHQGVVAEVEMPSYVPAETILDRLPSAALLVVLDGVEDPRNLGAVIRSAAAAGADGLFVPERRAVGLTATSVKAAAGAAERLPIARIGNVVAFLKRLKQSGLSVIGLDADGSVPWAGCDLTRPTALVIGAEGKGLRRLAKESCDEIIAIPMHGRVESLNLSVAAGIVLFEAVRQRRAMEWKIP
jgi:23S rRNA (guanosine2251-2'-O)-methyltransferase